MQGKNIPDSQQQQEFGGLANTGHPDTPSFQQLLGIKTELRTIIVNP